MTRKLGQKTPAPLKKQLLSQKCPHIFPWYFKVICEVINVMAIAMLIPLSKLFHLKLTVNNLPIFIFYSQPSFTPLVCFLMKEDSTTAWEAGAACLIIINLCLLSVLSQPWQFLLHSLYCSFHQGTENTHLCVKYLLKTQDKALSTGSCERAKRTNDSVPQYSTA